MAKFDLRGDNQAKGEVPWTNIDPGCFVVDRMIKQPTVLLKKQFSYRFSLCLHDLVRIWLE
jgi:hypothetical protein